MPLFVFSQIFALLGFGFKAREAYIEYNENIDESDFRTSKWI